MSLSTLQLATQGLFPLSPIAAAVQGLIEELQRTPAQPQGGKGYAGVGAPSDNYRITDESEALLHEDFMRELIEEEDEEILAAIMAAVTSGALNG